MIQLLESGAMREVAPGTYLLQKEIPRFPAELSEPPHVRIVIGRGVPVPRGKPGRTRVFLLETGACISGAHCQ